MQIILLGMHRSGTSAVAGLIHLMGAYVGDEKIYMPPTKDNPKGYWERMDVYRFNDKFLHDAGASWCQVAEFDLGRVSNALKDSYVHEVKNVLSDLDAHQPWVLKDPRLCLLFPLWRPLLAKPLCVFVYRSPIQVAQSLFRRDGIPVNVGLALWEKHNLSALQAIDGIPTFFVPHKELIADPAGTCESIYKWLAAHGVENLRLPAQSEITSFIDSTLFRNRGEEALLEEFINSRQAGLLSTMERKEIPHEIPALSAGAQDILDFFDKHSRLQDSHKTAVAEKEVLADAYKVAVADKDSLAKTFAGQVAEAHGIIKQQQEVIAQNGNELAKAHESISGVHGIIKQQQELIAEYSVDLQKLHQEKEILKKQSEEQLAERSGQLNESRQIISQQQALIDQAQEILYQTFKSAVEEKSAPPVSAPPQPKPSPSSGVLRYIVEEDTSEYEDIQYPELSPSKIKLIAFYLPQFHPIPENDVWWGRGFTEWTNVSKAMPQFVGHYQPHLPGELGFYDLRLVDVQRRQAELAKQYGIYGFCYHHYWFGGKRLLDRPFNQVLANPDIDLPFCLCWANENWTRRWDGQEKDILMAQKHSPEDDIAFIKDIEPALRDKRYIRVNGKPLLIVYRVDILPNAKATAQRWRDYCAKGGIGGLYLVAAQSFGITDPRPYGFDAAVQFPPHSAPREKVNHLKKLINPDFDGFIYNYEALVRASKAKQRSGYTLFRTAFPAWDNTARKGKSAHVFADGDPRLFKQWLDNICVQTVDELPEENRFVFINAWNEWAEGAHIEPDRKYGYAYLNRVAEISNKYSVGSSTSPHDKSIEILFVSHDAARAGAQILLLDLMEWIKKHTQIKFKILLINGGVLLDRFKNLAECLVFEEIKKNGSIVEELKNFTGETVDLVYANTVVSGSILEKLKYLHCPVLTHVHELEKSIKRFAGNEIMGKTVASTHKYIAASPPVKDNLVANHKIAPADIEVVNAFIKPQVDILPEAERMAVRKTLGLPVDMKLVFGCGSLDWRKGVDVFIELAAWIKKNTAEKSHFYWIGSGTIDYHIDYGADSRGAQKTFREYMTELDVADSVTFLGEQQNPRTFFQAGDIFALPSREDPFPLVCLEAANCGMPVVCFEGVGGMPGFVENDCGFVVPYPDVEAMAGKIAQLMGNPGLCAELGYNGFRKLMERHVVGVAAPDILNVITRNFFSTKAA